MRGDEVVAGKYVLLNLSGILFFFYRKKYWQTDGGRGGIFEMFLKKIGTKFFEN